jgi:serine/threonine protein kinase
MEKYDVIKQIGEGSFGKVFRAKRIQDGNFVALKFVPKVMHCHLKIMNDVISGEMLIIIPLTSFCTVGAIGTRNQQFASGM